MRVVEHGRARLALHALRDVAGPRLLLLHELGGSAPKALPESLAAWPGGVYALDFTGHGGSTVPRGGGYTSELLMADADAALAALGPCALVGHGLGAYVALLLAGARPREIRGAILCDGAGLAGGGAAPDRARLELLEDDRRALEGKVPDPFARIELEAEMRPPDYAVVFARRAASGSSLPVSIHVCARERPPWLEAVLLVPGVRESSLAQALVACAGR